MIYVFSGFIEKNTWSGLEDFYSHLQRVLLEEGTHLSVTKKKTRRRRRLMPVCATGSEEPKHRISRPAASKSKRLILQSINHRIHYEPVGELGHCLPTLASLA